MPGEVERVRVLGSLALALCHLADGRLDAVASLRPNGARSIDIAAAQLMILEAGSAIALPDAEGAFGAAPLDLVGRSRVVAARDDAVVARMAGLIGIGHAAFRAQPPN
jgi:myo-inositol-1(or 4)-monophosphatase